MKTPYRNGTAHVIFEPLDFIARLVGMLVLKGLLGHRDVRAELEPK